MVSGQFHSGAQGPVLRLTQVSEGVGNNYHVQLSLEVPSQSRRTAVAQFSFVLSDQEREDLRWYFEDYLQHPIDPAPQIAARIETWMAAKGEELFDNLFKANDDTRDLWSAIRQQLPNTRIEVSPGVHEATGIPWELLRDSRTDTLLALRAEAFVRTYSTPVLLPQLPATSSGPIRILLVICRPGKSQDVPFRSVASRIVKSLTDEARAHFTLDVLRPPTFEQLRQTLRRARDLGMPYHVVHFDGHGAFLDVPRLFENWHGNTPEADAALEKQLKEAGLTSFDRRRFSPEAIYPRQPREGRRGYLVFENLRSAYNIRLIDGPELGALLTESQVPVLVLNACRSAHAEAPTTPKRVGEDGDQAANLPDDHARVRAYGSFAQEVVDAGVGGVVAMRYNVYVVTAAQFVADLYASLTLGYTLGAAVREGRSRLHADPMRAIAYDPVRLQDWSVPVVYEAAPISLFPKQQGNGGIQVIIRNAKAAPARGDVDPHLPKKPGVGFYGRDETILALDRAFDSHQIVLLRAYAGGGKTATAAEFARWYSLTGGVQGPVLFTSFERPLSLSRALDTFGRLFDTALESSDIHWLALDNRQRREVALDVMNQVPLLWLWDNVEQVAGFPAGTPSILSMEEQKELEEFLIDANGTKAKFLLTSRREEQGWLGDLPARVEMPPMPMLERLELAKALAAKYGKRLDNVGDWRPLLRYTLGNPLTVTVVVGQALRDRLSTKEQITSYVAKLRAGETAFEDADSVGRTRSLGASLSYGFSHTFTEEERKQLALLHFFQGFVNANVLRAMANAETHENRSLTQGLTYEASIALLDRAAEVGLLTALGNGYYSIHPALSWYFKDPFKYYYGDNLEFPTLAYIVAMSYWVNYCSEQFEEGNRDIIHLLTFEEENLLYVQYLARAQSFWSGVINALQGLRALYGYTGRNSEWKHLVEEAILDFVDSTTEGPLSDREDEWSLVTQYRVHLAMDSRQWAEAEHLQRLHMQWSLQKAAPLLIIPLEDLNTSQRNTIRTVAVSLEDLGLVQRGQGKPECIREIEAAYTLLLRINERPRAAVAAFNLGKAYMEVPRLRNLERSEYWYKRSLELLDHRDMLGRAKCLITLGSLAYVRLQEALLSKPSKEILLCYLNDAIAYCMQALAVVPSEAVQDLANTHQALGAIYYATGNLSSALSHWREAIRYHEAAGNTYAAASTQFNIAVALKGEGRFVEALLYARTALSALSGSRGTDDLIQKMKELIAQINEKSEGS